MASGDLYLRCVDCGNEFLWDVGEQTWFHNKGLANVPKRCKYCRDQRRDQQLHQPRRYFTVKCETCGSPAYVPFVPRGIKPVYCRSCYSAVRA